MSDQYQCLNCKHLGSCALTDLEKLSTGFYCAQWEAAKPETVHARNNTIKSYGHQGLLSVLTTEIKED